jgi:hypothetical protein
MYMDVQTDQFFGSDSMPLPPLAIRDNYPKNIHQTSKLIEQQFKHLDNHKWFEQIKILRQDMEANRQIIS